MKILVASRNAHKLTEIREILAPYGLEVEDLNAWPEIGELPEEEDTFEGNALSKAHAAFNVTGCWTVADDSGIEIDSLGGAPGVRSKRFSPEETDEANNALLIERLQNTNDRTGRFRCAIALVGPNGQATASGAVEGQIAHSESGAGGFGYDPLFLPDEAPGRSMAEISPDEKNAISHRGRAFRQLPELLASLTD
jgi:XTP/dITP diphosphohydrolase